MITGSYDIFDGELIVVENGKTFRRAMSHSDAEYMIGLIKRADYIMSSGVVLHKDWEYGIGFCLFSRKDIEECLAVVAENSSDTVFLEIEDRFTEGIWWYLAGHYTDMQYEVRPFASDYTPDPNREDRW